MELSEKQLGSIISEAISKAQRQDISSPSYNAERLMWKPRRNLTRKTDALYDECGLKIPMDELVFYPNYPAEIVSKLVKTAYNADKWADIPIEYREEAQSLYNTVASLLFNILSRSLREQFLQ